MKIMIYTDDKKINLWLPTSLMKCKFIQKKILNRNFGFGESIDEYKETYKKIYKSLKEFKHKNGSFYLVDIQTADNTKVKIKI